MIERFNNRVKAAIVIYLLLITIVYIQKPRCMFTEEGKMIEFGVFSSQTLLSFPLCVILTSIFVYYMMGLICIHFSRCAS